MIGSFVKESEYRHGYNKAIIDIANWIERHSESIKHDKLNNTKGFLRLLKAFYENSEMFIQNGESLALRRNNDGSIILDGDGYEI